MEGIPCPNISSFNSLIDKVGNVLRQGAEKLSGFTLSFAAQTAAVTTNYLNFKEQFKQGKEWASNRLYWFNFNIEKENEETGTTFSERLAQDIMLNIETDGVGEMLEEGLEKLLGKGVIKRAGTKKIANEELINEFKKRKIISQKIERDYETLARSKNWMKEDGTPYWPLNDGFKGAPSKKILRAGDTFDRYGGTDGYFAAKTGTSKAERSLAPNSSNIPTKYRIRKGHSIEALEGEVAPWFGEKGRGIQYKFKDKIQKLIDDKVIEIVK